jgi:hypothetical protein
MMGSPIMPKHHVYTRLQKKMLHVKHYHGNKTFIKMFRIETKLTYA